MPTTARAEDADLQIVSTYRRGEVVDLSMEAMTLGAMGDAVEDGMLRSANTQEDPTWEDYAESWNDVFDIVVQALDHTWHYVSPPIFNFTAVEDANQFDILVQTAISEAFDLDAQRVLAQGLESEFGYDVYNESFDAVNGLPVSTMGSLTFLTTMVPIREARYSDLEHVLLNWIVYIQANGPSIEGIEQGGTAGTENDGDYLIVTTYAMAYTTMQSPQYVTVGSTNWYFSQDAPNGNVVTGVRARIKRDLLQFYTDDTYLTLVLNPSGGHVYVQTWVTQNETTTTYLGGNVCPDAINSVTTNGRYSYSYFGAVESNMSMDGTVLTFDLSVRSRNENSYTNKYFSLGNTSPSYGQAIYKGNIGQAPDVGGGEGGSGGSGGSGDVIGYTPPVYYDYSQQYDGDTTNITNNTTVNNQGSGDSYDLDLSPLTRRIDVLNGMVEDIGKDLNRLGDDIRRWLERIYGVLNGIGSSNQVQYSEDEPWDPIVLPEFDMDTQVQDLSQVFPFSIPSDLSAILGVVNAQAVTPVLNLTFPAYGNVTQAQTFTLDLSAYDTTMSAVRTVEVIMFVIGLAFMSYRLIGGGD